MFFNQYPYINMNDLNLDFLLKAIGDMKYEVENFVSINAIKYADPIQWNITSQYEKNTIVIDPQSGTAYISVAPVPVGVSLTNTDFWTVVFDLERFVTKANGNFTLRVEEQTTLTATFPTPEGAWVVWGGVLYEAMTNIIAGDQYVEDSNIKRLTVEEAINRILTALANEATARENADTTLQGNIDAEATARENADTTLQGNIDALEGEILGKLPLITPEEFGAIGDGVANDRNALIDAFNKAISTNGTVFLSKRYLINNTIEVTTIPNIMGSGVIVYNGSGAALKIGGATPTDDKHVILNIVSENQFTPTSGSVGVDIINATGCIFELNVTGFEIGVICHGYNAGWQNNTTFFKYIYNCDTCVILRAEGTGWVNSNTFIGGRIGQASAFTGTNKIGFHLNDLSNNHYVNNNIFINNNLENTLTALKLNKTRTNEFWGLRLENVTTKVQYDDISAHLNIIRPNYAQSENRFGFENVYSRLMEAFKYELRLPLDGYVTNASYFSCKNICDNDFHPYVAGITTTGRYAVIPSTTQIGARINVSSKYLIIDCDSKTDYRAFVCCFNGGTVIAENLLCVYDTDFYGYVAYTSPITINGMTFAQTSPAINKRMLILPDNCDNVLILISAPVNQTINISNISVFSTKDLGLVTYGNSSHPVLPSAPTSDSPSGTLVLSSAPTSTLKGWVKGSSWLTF